jgi:hypothetical protein
MSTQEITLQIPNLAELVNDSMAKAFSIDNIQGIVDTHVKKVMADALERLFSYNGPIRAQVKDYVVQTVGIDTSKIPLINYTELLANAAQKSIIAHENTTIKDHADKLFADLIKSAPAVCSIADIIEKYREAVEMDMSSELEDIAQDYDDGENEGGVERDLGFTNEERYPDTSCLRDYKALTFCVEDIPKCP